MKVFCLLICLALTIIACQKSAEPIEPEPSEPIIELGKVAMNRDSQPWTANFTANYDYFPVKSSFSFSAETIFQNGVLEVIGIVDIPSNPGIYNVSKTFSGVGSHLIPRTILGWSLDGDQILGVLSADSTYYDNNIVEVIRYDSIENVVEGRFQVRLKKSLGTPAAFGLPEEVSLTNGRFHLKIEE